MNANGQCSKGDNCSFRHDMNKRAKIDTKMYHAAECEKCIENQKSYRQKPKWENGSIASARITSKELAPLNSVTSGILQNDCSTSQKMDADLEKSALMRTARLMNSLAKGIKRMVTKVQWQC